MTLFESPLHESRARATRRWIAAATLVAALHVGSASLAYVTWPPSDELSEDFGAPMVVELAATPASSDADASEDSPGDPQPAAPQTPEVMQSLSTASDPDQPVAPASPYKPPPDLLVAQEQTREKSDHAENDQPTERMEESPPTPPSSAAQAASTASMPLPDDKALVGSPSEGSTLEMARAEETWRRALVAHLGKHKRYPQAAREKGVEGVATVRFVLDRGGRVVERAVVGSSGSPILDEAVIALLDRASPLPSLPSHLRGEKLELTIPIRYKLK